MKKILLLTTAFLSIATFAQQAGDAKAEEAWKKQYRAFDTKVNNLVHTKLQASFLPCYTRRS